MGIGIWELIIIFGIVLMLFGTKRFRAMGGDLGAAIRSFRSSLNEDSVTLPGEASPGAVDTASTRDQG